MLCIKNWGWEESGRFVSVCSDSFGFGLQKCDTSFYSLCFMSDESVWKNCLKGDMESTFKCQFIIANTIFSTYLWVIIENKVGLYQDDLQLLSHSNGRLLKCFLKLWPHFPWTASFHKEHLNFFWLTAFVFASLKKINILDKHWDFSEGPPICQCKKLQLYLDWESWALSWLVS